MKKGSFIWSLVFALLSMQCGAATTGIENITQEQTESDLKHETETVKRTTRIIWTKKPTFHHFPQLPKYSFNSAFEHRTTYRNTQAYTKLFQLYCVMLT